MTATSKRQIRFTKSIRLVLDQELLDALTEAARAEDRPRSGLIRHILRDALSQAGQIKPKKS